MDLVGTGDRRLLGSFARTRGHAQLATEYVRDNVLQSNGKRKQRDARRYQAEILKWAGDVK